MEEYTLLLRVEELGITKEAMALRLTDIVA